MTLSPTALILKRCQAFAEGDFGFVWDCHHPESFFRQLYSDRDDYLEYARGVLGKDFRILECRILKEEGGEAEARVLYLLDILFRGERRESFELSWLRRLEGQWRYLATQKIERQDFAGTPEEIGWEDFEKIEDKVLF